MKEKLSPSGCILLVILFVIIYIGGLWLSAYTTTHLWAWFVVSTFGVPALSMRAAMGINILITHFVFNPNSATKESKHDSSWDALATFAGAALGTNLLILVMGYLVHVL